MNFDLDRLVRDNIRELTPYSSARDEFKGEAKIFLDANENSLGSPLVKWYNRYPDPRQAELKKAISKVKGLAPEHIFLGNGSDECIDLLYRCFCTPGKDNVIVCPPTYGMYEVSGHINDVEVRKAMLQPDFQLHVAQVEQLVDENTKIIWICSPNNPTGNSFNREDIETILNNFNGLVVIDEAYVNFSRHKSFLQELKDYPQLVVLQTFSKAWGLAALRLGMAFASPDIISILDKVKPPYNINKATQDLVKEALNDIDQVNDMIKDLVDMRNALFSVLEKHPLVEKVYPSDANFLLVKMKGARKIYEYLLTRGIVVRDRSNIQLCDDCLRITIGTEDEITLMMRALKEYVKKP
ncbi:MAG: histidinol-phosphate transaminase [Chitinophagaceae bacterium]|nr:histidinol-phosphate transaminase [Chitinophagaceae bacterium]